MATGTQPRAAALAILRAVRSGERFDRALDDRIPSLTAADRRLAHEIAAGVLRERSALDSQIIGLLTQPERPLPDDLRDVLRIGVYQLTHLDRVPPYAAVQSTVELAKGACGHRYSRLVNALLRRVAEVGGSGVADAPGSPDDLATRYSHPAWLVKRWLAQFGPRRTRELLEHDNGRPPLVLQAARWRPERLRDALADAGVLLRDADAGFVVSCSNVRDLPGYADGGFIVQDSTQRRLVAHAAVPADATVWDACAAPGGKAALLSQRSRVLASDRSPRRLQRLRDTLARVSPGVPIIVADARFPPVHASAVDVVMVDAPCSATGTMARHPDARWRLSEARIAEAAALQAELLDGASRVVRPGAVLAYLTCSLESEENAEQVDRFLERHPDFTRDADDLFVFPSAHGADGGFAARLRRTR